MRRQICWVKKLEGGIKREIRVTFPGGQKIKWQFKRSDEAQWDYDSVPTPEDWQSLLDRAQRRYQRKRIPFEEVELIQKYVKKVLDR